jgi:glycerophosphoryl diester phosphodiesterase
MPRVPPRPFRDVVSIAHRGASGHAPEHTFAAYDLAMEMDCDYLEQDLQLTRDGVLVCLHDDTLDRTVRGAAGRVDALDLAELEALDAGSWFSPEFATERVPTLDAVFARYGHEANYYIETKAPDTADRMEERLLALMAEHGLIEPARERRQVLIQSFSQASLLKLRAADPDLPLIQLLGRSNEALFDRLDEVASYAVGIGPHKGRIDAGLLGRAHDLGLDVHPFTINESDELAGFVAQGIDGAFCNYPDRFAEVVPREPRA